MNDDLSKMTTEQLFEEAIDWLRDTQKRNATDVLFNMSYVQEYLQEITDRCYAEINKDE